MFDGLDETATDAATSLAFGDHQTPDLADATDFQDFLLGGVNPSNDCCRFRNEEDVVFALPQPFEPFGHDTRFDRITEHCAQFRHGLRVSYLRFSNRQIAHFQIPR